MFNDLKIKGALLDVIRYMEEDDCTELGEPIKYKNREYYVSIDIVKK